MRPIFGVVVQFSQHVGVNWHRVNLCCDIPRMTSRVVVLIETVIPPKLIVHKSRETTHGIIYSVPITCGTNGIVQHEGHSIVRRVNLQCHRNPQELLLGEVQGLTVLVVQFRTDGRREPTDCSF